MSDISFEVNGRSYPFVAPAEMTMDEARELKRISGGMGLASVETALQDVDPDAWTAVLLVSMRRVDPAAKDDVLDSVSPAELIGTMAEAIAAAQAEADAVPPPSPAGGNGPASSSGAMTLEVAGT